MQHNKKKLIEETLPLKVLETDENESEFFRSVAELIQKARCGIEKQVNTAMVVTYFEIGRRIIEKEQQGEKRAKYGEKILQGLSDYLTAHLGRGYSVENLKLMRRFYVVYAEPVIEEPAVSQSIVQIGQSVITQFRSNIRQDENPTIGIVLCRDKKDAMVEMMLLENNDRIFAAKYKTVLPSKEELKKLLEYQ